MEVAANADGEVEAVVFDKVESKSVDGRWAPTGEQVTMKCDLVLLAIGFVHPEHAGVLEDAEVKLDVRGNIATTGFQTNRDGLFAAGDARRGQSLVVWAIAGRAAKAMVGYWSNLTSFTLNSRPIDARIISWMEHRYINEQQKGGSKIQRLFSVF